MHRPAGSSARMFTSLLISMSYSSEPEMVPKRSIPTDGTLVWVGAICCLPPEPHPLPVKQESYDAVDALFYLEMRWAARQAFLR